MKTNGHPGDLKPLWILQMLIGFDSIMVICTGTSGIQTPEFGHMIWRRNFKLLKVYRQSDTTRHVIRKAHLSLIQLS